MDDLKLAALLCTRLCHDLVGPVGAINNGLELLGDGGGDLDDEVMALIQRSARETARRLQFFRAAFGLASGGKRGFSSASEVAARFFDGGKIALDWTGAAPAPFPANEDACAQIMLNLLLCGAEMLPRGGRLSARVAAEAGKVALSVAAAGPTIKIDDDLETRLDGRATVATIDARRVQPHYTARLVAALGGNVELGDRTEGSVEVRARVPAVGDKIR